MANSYPNAPVPEETNAKYPNGYSEVTGVSVWTWTEVTDAVTNEKTSEWVVTARPDKTGNYGI